MASTSVAPIHGLAMLQAASIALGDHNCSPTATSYTHPHHHRMTDSRPCHDLTTTPKSDESIVNVPSRNSTHHHHHRNDIMHSTTTISNSNQHHQHHHQYPQSTSTPPPPPDSSPLRYQYQAHSPRPHHHHHTSPASSSSLSALLNPAPLSIAASLPAGFVLGKDGKIKKKRGRKPTPGLSDEDRRKARLLKNRRTAEISRRRKLAQLNKLAEERDCAQQSVEQLRSVNEHLLCKLAAAMGMTKGELAEKDEIIALAVSLQRGNGGDVKKKQERDEEEEEEEEEEENDDHGSNHFDVSAAGSVIDSDEEGTCNGGTTSTSPGIPHHAYAKS